MAKCFIEDATLTAIGNAIRAKTGGTDLMLPSAMPAAIAGIVSGEGLYVWKKYDAVISSVSLKGDGVVANLAHLNQFINMANGNPYYDSDYNYLGECDGGPYNINYYYTIQNPSSSTSMGFIIAKITEETTPLPIKYWEDYTINYNKNFINYVVSDDESQYPDGAVHTDGYYYERVSEGITPQMFGCTKMAVDTYTPTSNIALDSISIPHSLGEIPKIFFILAEKKITAENYAYINYVSGYKNGFGGLGYFDSKEYIVSQYGTFVSKSIINLPNFPSYTATNTGTASILFRYKSGVTYKVITMA